MGKYKNPLNSSKPLSGKQGKVFLDNDFIVNITSITAKIVLQYAEYDLLGDLWKRRKLVGLSGEGSLKFKKVTSRLLELTRDVWENGKQVSFEVMVVLDDPAGYGIERVMLNDVTFDEIPFVPLTGEELMECEIPFKFTGVELLNAISTTELSTI